MFGGIGSLESGILAIGICFVLFSAYRWNADPHRKGLTGTPPRDGVRAALFIIWTLTLPLVFLVQWYSNPTPSNMLVYQYEHKVWTDAWAAVAVVLGLLFGLKKS